jgi:very-short-patch-repair endonuclease
MLKENQKILTTWANPNKLHYINKGYKFTKIGDVFEVNAEDLPLNSHCKVKVICDYCGNEIERTFQWYNKLHDNIFGDTCNKCKNVKSRLTNLTKYGCENPQQNQFVQEKSKMTMKNKYGVEHALQCDKILEAQKHTMLERFGVDNIFKSDKFKQDMIDLNIKKYGVKNYTQTKEYKEKAKKTCNEKYGCDFAGQAQEVIEKRVKTLYNNHNYKSSKQEIEIYNLLVELYGEKNCIKDYFFSRVIMDILLNINDCKIDIEYDGWYWHKDNQQYDRRRDEFLKSQGYKILRIKASHNIPTKTQLLKAIDYLVKGNHSYTEIILDI